MKSEGENIRRNAQTNILQYFIKHGVGNLVYKGLDYKAIQSMRTSWDVDKLRKYLGNKHGIKILNKQTMHFEGIHQQSNHPKKKKKKNINLYNFSLHSLNNFF